MTAIFRYKLLIYIILIIGCTKEKQPKHSLEGIYIIKVTVTDRMEVFQDSFPGISTYKGRYIYPGNGQYCCDNLINYSHGCPREYEIGGFEILKFKGEYYLKNRASRDASGNLTAKHIPLEISNDLITIPKNSSFSRPASGGEYFNGVTFVDFTFDNNNSDRKKGQWFLIDHTGYCRERRHEKTPQMGEQSTIELIKQ